MKTLWKKIGRRTCAGILAAIVLSAALPLLGVFPGVGVTEVYAAETIPRIIVTSDLYQICVAGNDLRDPVFTVEQEGQPVAFISGQWEEENWNGSEYAWSKSTDSSFQEGEVYRYSAVFGIEHNGKYKISDSVQFLVGSGSYRVWGVDNVVQQESASSSYVYVHSGSIIAEDALKSERTYVIASAKDPNYVLDVAGGSFMPKANVDIYKRNNTEGQAFTLTQLSDGWQIKNYKGTVLDIASGSTANKANVQTYTWNNSKAQKYDIEKNKDGTYTFINKKSGKALDIAGGKMANKTNVQQYTTNGSKAQKWILIDVTDDVHKRFGYKDLDGWETMIWTFKDFDFALDIASGSTANKANVQLYKGNGSAAQIFTFTYRGGGFYSITNKKSGKVLDVAGGKAVNKANVQQYTWNGSKGQLWEIGTRGEAYLIRSALNKNFVLDLAGGKAQNKKNIQIYQYNGSSAQAWDFRSWSSHQEMG